MNDTIYVWTYYQMNGPVICRMDVLSTEHTYCQLYECSMYRMSVLPIDNWMNGPITNIIINWTCECSYCQRWIINWADMNEWFNERIAYWIIYSIEWYQVRTKVSLIEWVYYQFDNWLNGQINVLPIELSLQFNDTIYVLTYERVNVWMNW